MENEHNDLKIRKKARTPKSNNNIALLPIPGQKARTPCQAFLDIKISRQIEIYGVGMGVLTDGQNLLGMSILIANCTLLDIVDLTSLRVSSYGLDGQKLKLVLDHT